MVVMCPGNGGPGRWCRRWLHVERSVWWPWRLCWWWYWCAVWGASGGSLGGHVGQVVCVWVLLGAVGSTGVVVMWCGCRHDRCGAEESSQVHSGAHPSLLAFRHHRAAVPGAGLVVSMAAWWAARRVGSCQSTLGTFDPRGPALGGLGAIPMKPRGTELHLAMLGVGRTLSSCLELRRPAWQTLPCVAP